ncbi:MULTISPECIES: extracellular matrix regulator RemB [Pontibacillus]|uniref:DUF370 domain-containing protein n=1 Tax=Pontibacillus chungwhensis TaxID=265426 RepID=A0ABY8V026_9BACI|nr:MULTISPECIES: extracellular matrix/biofilm biosynthesis regulator RemA family protein [Pontibacillus]MCD5325608.1 DUF370 domain-containing protein [Pontibacillus sp. HN14]WIF98144.1 DUF370 domain-containing protein [Pontibacillus chungwhensis]
MFIHIGEDHVIESGDVISIIDFELLSSSSIVEEMIQNQRLNQRVFESPNAEAKSIVITRDYIYFSPLSVFTLKKRANMTSTLNKIEDFAE